MNEINDSSMFYQQFGSPNVPIKTSGGERGKANIILQ